MQEAQGPLMPEESQNQAIVPDVTLAFTTWLQKARENTWLHFSCDSASLRSVVLWDFGEDGGCYHHYQSQHEKVTSSFHQYPASRDNHTTYYRDEQVPEHRPTPNNFSNHTYTYPLNSTREIFECPTCHATGKVRCPSCSGSGRCSNCRGSGRAGQEKKRCWRCGGSGRCPTCQGTGKVTCRPCNGEGRLLSYTSMDYRWWHKPNEDTIVSPVVNRIGVKGLISGVRKKGGGVGIAHFTQSDVLAATGVLNRRIQDLLQHAESARLKLEADIAAQSDRVLFQEIHRVYIPLLYINLFAGRRYGQCFVAGTQAHHEVSFPVPYSPAKLVAWALLIVIGVFFAVGIVDWLLLVPLIALFVGLTAYTTWLSVRAVRQPLPERWMIFDDQANRAWQLAYLLAQAVSRARAARIADPWFTSLLEPPQADSVHGRNSFVFRMEQNRPERNASEAPEQTTLEAQRQAVEVFVAGQRAQHQYKPDVDHLAASATRLIFFADGRTEADLSLFIQESLAARLATKSPTVQPVEIAIVSESALLFSDGLQALANEEQKVTVHLLTLPLSLMCAQARIGEVSDETAAGYRRILEFAGVDPDAEATADAKMADAVAQRLAAHLKHDIEQKQAQTVFSSHN